MKRAWRKRVILCVTTACACALLIALAIKDTRQNGSIDGAADLIVVQKRNHTLALYRQGKLLKTYHVALGRGGLGPKTQAGDNKVPEGVYRIVAHNPHSAFHLALKVGYPTPDQIHQAQLRGTNAGGDIMIHGIKNGLGWVGSMQRRVDWTKGCIAVTDHEIEEISRAVPDGTPIQINR